MEEIRVKSWTELLESLYADSWQAGLGRFRSNQAFRGLETPGDELRTGLMRRQYTGRAEPREGPVHEETGP